MNRRDAYTRWSRTQSRLKKRLSAIALLAVAGSAALMALALVLRQPEPDRPAPLIVASAAPVVLRVASGTVPVEAPKKTRRIYPYSIIPGGVSGRDELARTIKNDKVVAVHYASFNVSDARAVTVTRPRGVYVSYRKGDKVYWTAKKLMLAQGETLLSDGSSEIRTRCGNRVSDVPQLPVEAKGPTAEELDSSVEQAQEGAEQSGLQLASLSMDENGEMPSLAGLAYQLPVLASATTVAQASNEPRSYGTFGKLGSSGGIGDSPTSFFDLRPATAGTSEAKPSGSDGSGSGSTGNPPSNTGSTGSGGTDSPPGTGDSGSGGTPGTPTPPASSQPDGGGTGSDSGSQTSPGNPVLPNAPTNPGGSKPDTGTEVPPDLLSPPTFPVKPAPPAQNHGVPEPGTLWLTGAALGALLLLRRMRHRSKR